MNISPNTPPAFLRQNRRELQLVLEELKAREQRATDPADLAEIRSQQATWGSMYQAAGGDPGKVRPASFGNDFRMALAERGFPMLDPERYTPQENGIAEVREWQLAARDMGGPDHEVLVRREGYLQKGLALQKKADRMFAGGLSLAQLSWIAAIPAYMVAGGAGLVGCAGALATGVGLIMAAHQVEQKSRVVVLEQGMSDLTVVANWSQNGARYVEDFTRRQAERYNNAWMEKALKPEPSGIAETQGAIMVGGVRLKTRR